MPPAATTMTQPFTILIDYDAVEFAGCFLLWLKKNSWDLAVGRGWRREACGAKRDTNSLDSGLPLSDGYPLAPKVILIPKIDWS